MKTLIVNGKIITAEGILNHASLLIENGLIKEIVKSSSSITGAIRYDAGGNYVSPGFIDLHLHGGGGFDFMDGTAGAFREVAKTHIDHGTTSMLPTTLTSTKENLHAVLDTYTEACKDPLLASVFCGIHIEGPYFSMSHRGAQDPRFIRNPDRMEYSEILARHTCIKRWSVAPELDGALEFGNLLASQNIIASIAHTDALYDDILKAYKNGYSLVTHLYSAMNGVVRRNAYRFAGAVEAAFLLDGLDVEIIADGRHLPIPLLQLVYKVKGAGSIALITDAMRAAGTDHASSILGNLEDGIPVIIEDEVAKLPDRTSFAGSIATADRLVRVMWKEAGIELAEVIRMISSTPAKILGITQNKGSIVPGIDADLVIFDEDVRIKEVFLLGNPWFKSIREGD
jgi:N-acetylglucosamine-6-phosphate deacetylase